jgi:uncharacterized protein YggT (Ycf19 family)
MGTFISCFFWVVEVYAYLIFFRIIAFWMNPVPDNPILSVLFRITNPGLDFLRLFPPIAIGGSYIHELTPLIIIMIYVIVRNIFRGLSR